MTALTKSVEEVREFWGTNPLFSGESEFEPGSKEFFDEHTSVYYDDVFAGSFTEQLFIPKLEKGARVLDLGCGVGFWVIEILKRNPEIEMYAADLTTNALEITKMRLEQFGFTAKLDQQNAENMDYEDESFDHINCQGVIHHTPDTEASVKEIARVLKPGGTANISVYYRNLFIRNWKPLRPVGKLISGFGAGLKGRGRENIFLENDVDEITRLYDGDRNRIGKSYSKKDLLKIVEPYFQVEESFLNFFPARSLPFPIPKSLHKILSRQLGFMIHFNMRKAV